MKTKILIFLSGMILWNGTLHTQKEHMLDDLFLKWSDSDILQPGIAVAVIQGESVSFQKSFGYANVEYEVPLDDQSIFDIASLAKQFTGFAVAKLVLENKIGLEEPLADYFPDIPILSKKQIMVKHLVYHTSGLRDVGELFDLANLGEDFTANEARWLIKNQQELNFTPGREYDYSNTNYVLLALLVEKVSKMRFRDWCTENIFLPLGMKSTFVNDQATEIIKNRAIAYYGQGSSLGFQQNNGMALIGSSAVYSNLRDLTRWTKALLHESQFPAVFKLMKQKGRLEDGSEISYGFGLGVDYLQDEFMLEHTGATPAGFRTAMAIFPAKSLAIVLLSNWGDLDPIQSFGKPILSRYIPELASKATAKQEITPTRMELDPKQLQKYTGDYLFNGELNVAIRKIEDGHLGISVDGRPQAKLIPLSETDFDFPAMRSQLHFILDANGNYQQVKVLANGQQEGLLVRQTKELKKELDLKKYAGLYYSEELKIAFEISVQDEGLVLLNSKQGKVVLHHKSKHQFSPEKGFASSLVFEVSPKNEVLGYFLNRGSRLRNMKFKKINYK